MSHTSQTNLISQAFVGLRITHLNWRRIFAAAICSLGGTVFGYDLGAVSSASQGLLSTYALSPALLGLTVSASLWGAVIASPIAGRLADKLGRRGLLALCALVYACAALALASPVHLPLPMILVLRLLSGLAIGGFVVGCPLYLAEIAPRASRGRFVGWFQFQIGVGVVVAFSVSAFLAKSLPEAVEWRWCFGFGAVPPAFLLALLHWLPEEPHWLAAKGRMAGAAQASRRLGSTQEDLEVNFAAPVALPPSKIFTERLFQRRYLRPLLLATSVALFNQLCGVTVLRVYLLELLSGSGMERTLSHRYGVVISCLNLVALLLGMMVVDKIGRRPLLIWGSAGMAICLFALAWALRHHSEAFTYLVTLVAYNSFFACSQGAAAWVYLSEIFPFPVRGNGQGFGALVHWIANASLIWLFPVMEHAVPQSSFVLFGLCMVLQIALVFLWYPETKGTRLGEVAELTY